MDVEAGMEARESVISRARAYREAMARWEGRAPSDTAGSLRLWRQTQEAEKALFSARDALDEEGAGGDGEPATPADGGGV